MTPKRQSLLVVALFTFISVSEIRAEVVWFVSPASDWEPEGLPIGNGAMGAIVTGGIDTEVLQFNETTLWEGGPGVQEPVRAPSVERRLPSQHQFADELLAHSLLATRGGRLTGSALLRALPVQPRSRIFAKPCLPGNESGGRALAGCTAQAPGNGSLGGQPGLFPRARALCRARGYAKLPICHLIR